MASRGFFGYDPYDYYTAAPYNYPYDAYYTVAPSTRSRRSAKPSRRDRDRDRDRDRERDTKTSFEIPVTGPDSDDPKPAPKPKPAAMSAEDAAVRVQAAARGLLARKSVRAVRSVEVLAGQVLAKISSSEAEAMLAADPRARVAVAEALMRMLLRLDAVRGAREYRRRITKRVLAMQDAVDALETAPPPPPAVDEVAEEDSAVVVLDEAPSMTRYTTPPPTSCSEVDDDGAIAVAAGGQPDDEAGEEEEEEKEAEPASYNFFVMDIDVHGEADEGSEADGEWEMVAEEHEHSNTVAATSEFDDDHHQEQEPPCKEPPADTSLETTKTTTAATASAGTVVDGGVDASKLMQIVAELCERNAKQCSVICRLEERVEALERTVRRMEEDAENRSRDKKLDAEDK